MTSFDREISVAELAKELVTAQSPLIVGIAGIPGSGKSTLADSLKSLIGETAVVVPMDGFHLHNSELDALGLRMSKGAIETFDVRGFVSLINRIRNRDFPVYCPDFDRTIDMSIAGAIRVDRSHKFIIVEGNYLFSNAPIWSELRELFDRSFFISLEQDQQVQRLTERHIRFGMSQEQAIDWVRKVDLPNSKALVSGTNLVSIEVLKIVDDERS